MTPKEFKAWFDGFTEGIAGLPNEKQWLRIKERVNEIDGTTVSYPVYLDRYVYRGNPYIAYGVGTTNAYGQTYVSSANQISQDFDSLKAMYGVGKNDFETT